MGLSFLIDVFLNLLLDALEDVASQALQERLPVEYISTLEDPDKIDALRACLIIYVLTSTKIVPRVFQLRASIANLNGRDTIITAGTGCGKTLCLLIPLLLRPNTISVTISPLKRLQTTQVLECQKYGISTIAINEDTPNDPDLWNSIKSGCYRHLIVSPEQLSMFNGHLPRLARLIRQDRSFTSQIRRVHIDEAHNIYTAGLSHHGEPAFRPAYGRLGDFRVLLSRGTPFQVLSATLPPHILAALKRELNLASDHLHIRLSTNRPNITYAVTTLPTSLNDFRNLNFLLPTHLHPPMRIPKTLIFHDCKREATDAALHIDSRLPGHLRNRGIVKHYHSDMSARYLQQTYEDFSSPDGACRILHATAGASTGLDIRGVEVVIQYGICKNMSEMIQRAGRAARDPDVRSLFLEMLDPWVFQHEVDGQTPTDPDRPSAGVVTKTSSKQDRTGCASIQFAQSTTCRRNFLVDYLDDQEPGAMDFDTQWCCDNHPNTDFSLSSFFLGDMGNDHDRRDEPTDEITARKRKRIEYRALEDRPLLLQELENWRKDTYTQDPLSAVRPATWLCDDDGLKLLSKTHPTNLRSVKDIVDLLEQTEEWGKEIGLQLYTFIEKFDKARVRNRIDEWRKKARASHVDTNA